MTTPETPSKDPAAQPHYQEPGWFTKNVFNRSVAFLTRMGISVWGSRELRVKGRTSGEWRTTPVNLLTVDGTALPGRAPRRHAMGAQPAGRRIRRAARRAAHRDVPRHRAAPTPTRCRSCGPT